MSVFYCKAHHRLEDSDYVGFYLTESGEELCEDAYIDRMDEEEAEATDDGWG